MRPKALIKRHWKTGLAIFACWTFLTVLFGPQTYLANLSSRTPLTVWQALSANSILFYVWALFTPFVLWLGGLFPLERGSVARNVGLHLLLSLVVSVLHIVVVLYANEILLYWAEIYEPPTPVRVLLTGMGATNVMVYCGIIAASQAISYFRKFQERDLQLTQAELQVLKMQLHPHFLFNTINAISELVYDEPEIADRTLGQLSDLLRLSLKGGKTQEVPLREELDFLEKYIEIQQTLLQERLTVDFDIDPDTWNAKVPNMILQPLAENAIRHGIAPSISGGTLAIAAYRRNGDLLLSVKDNGVGFAAAAEIVKSDGIGLANTRARLEQLYGLRHRFQMSEPAGGGVQIDISVPFDEAIDED